MSEVRKRIFDGRVLHVGDYFKVKRYSDKYNEGTVIKIWDCHPFIGVHYKGYDYTEKGTFDPKENYHSIDFSLIGEIAKNRPPRSGFGRFVREIERR